MNIIFLHSSSDLYGASKILLAVTSLCQNRSHKITVVLSEPGQLSDKLSLMGVEVIFMDLGILRRQYMNITGIFNRFSTIRKAFTALKNLCRDKKIDLVYSNTTGVIVGSFVARALGIRNIWHVHEILEKPFPLFRGISYLLNQRQNEVLAVSGAVKKHWARFLYNDKITVLYNGVDHWLFEDPASSFRQELGINENAVVLGMMGRVHFWKGQDYFLRIAGILHKEFPEMVFVSVGDAFTGYEYLYDRLDAIITEEKLEKVVKQVHYREDISNIYHSLDIFILPSLLPDPAPAVVTEAMSASRPVVITNQGGALEMIEAGVSGLVIPINNAGVAAEMIATLVRDKTYRENMGKQAQQRIVSHFSRDIFNKKIIDFIEQT